MSQLINDKVLDNLYGYNNDDFNYVDYLSTWASEYRKFFDLTRKYDRELDMEIREKLVFMEDLETLARWFNEEFNEPIYTREQFLRELKLRKLGI